MVAICTSCGQNQTEEKKIIVKSETKEAITSHGPESSLEISYKIERATFGLRHLMVFFGTMESLLPILQVK